MLANLQKKVLGKEAPKSEDGAIFLGQRYNIIQLYIFFTEICHKLSLILMLYAIYLSNDSLHTKYVVSYNYSKTVIEL